MSYEFQYYRIQKTKKILTVVEHITYTDQSIINHDLITSQKLLQIYVVKKK